jgi:hypothetical protein
MFASFKTSYVLGYSKKAAGLTGAAVFASMANYMQKLQNHAILYTVRNECEISMKKSTAKSKFYCALNLFIPKRKQTLYQ